MIDARGLWMRYGTFTALADASFHANRGEVVGLLGPNGAGKTTTMRILTTFQRPVAGTATVAGFDVVEQPFEVRRRIGYLPESVPLYLAMEVAECLEFVGRARGLRGSELRRRIDWVVERCGLGSVYRTPTIQTSKGFRQRTALAQALIHDPEVVILDEPTSGLDPHQIVGIRELIRELAATKTVILSTHILQEASALADRLIVVAGGHIVGQGTVDELRQQASVWPQVHVQFALDAPGAAEKLAALPGCGEVRSPAPRTYALRETDPGLAERVGALAQREGWPLAELSREPGSLEDVFLALTALVTEMPAPPAAPTPPGETPTAEVAA